jgi:hypothetical protein
MFSMQHHGIPTRLLDWSENLFIALYFALGEAPKDHKELHEGPCLPAVWLLDPKTWNRRALAHQEDEEIESAVLTINDEDLKFYAPDLLVDRFQKRYRNPVALYGTHNSARIVAQRGAFTIAGNDWRPMEDFATRMNAPEKGGLVRFIVTGDVEGLKDNLRALGFSHSMVYPDLPGLSTEVAAAEGWRSPVGTK